MIHWNFYLENLLTLWPFGPLTPVDPRWPGGPWGHRVKRFTQGNYRKAVSCGVQVSQLPKILFMDPNFTSARVLIMWPTYWVMPLPDNGVVGGSLSKLKGGGADFSVVLGLCHFGKRRPMKTWIENKFKVNITRGGKCREKKTFSNVFLKCLFLIVCIFLCFNLLKQWQCR